MVIQTVIDFMSSAGDILMDMAEDLNDPSIVRPIWQMFDVEVETFSNQVLNNYIDRSLIATGLVHTNFLAFRVLFVEGTRFFIEAIPDE